MFYCSAQTTSIMISSWEPFNLALDAADGTSKAKTPRWIKHNRRFKTSWTCIQTGAFTSWSESRAKYVSPGTERTIDEYQL